MKATLKLFYIFLLINNSYSQSKIKASIVIDSLGNMYVTQYLDKKGNDTILFNEKIKFYNENTTKLDKSIKIFDKTFYHYLINDSLIEYPFATTKNKYDDYSVGKNFFYTSLSYLGLYKNSLKDKKQFDLLFKLPKGFTLVYPTKKDLESDFNHIPLIIAGKYNEYFIRGFKIYSSEREDKKIKRIALILDKSFQYYSKYYGGKIRKPKITFIPFVTSLEGKVGENIILFDHDLLKAENIDTSIIAQQTAKLWWSLNSTKFSDFAYNESISEFMSMQFLKEVKNNNELLNSLNVKNYNCEGLFSSEVSEVKKSTYLLSNYLLPLLFVDKQNKNPIFFKKIGSFRIANENKINIDDKDLDFFLKSNKLNSVFEDYNFMDLSIDEIIDKKEIIIKCDKKIKESITFPIQIIDSNNKIYMENIILSEAEPTFNRSVKNIKKIIIDPAFSILQSSSLNDVWMDNINTYFARNKYFDFEKLNPKALHIGNILIDFLTNQNDEILNLINDNISKNKETLADIKKELNLSAESKIEGASIFHENGRKIIEIKLLKKTSVKSKLFVIRLLLNPNLTSISRIMYNETFFDYRRN